MQQKILNPFIGVINLKNSLKPKDRVAAQQLAATAANFRKHI
jgi:hypothetical protein